MTTGELARARRNALRTMTGTCTVQRATRASDGAGGQTETWATASTVACRIVPGGRNPEERIIAERIQAAVPFTVVVPFDADVSERDRITSDGQTYQIRGVLAPATDATLVRCVCERIG